MKILYSKLWWTNLTNTARRAIWLRNCLTVKRYVKYNTCIRYVRYIIWILFAGRVFRSPWINQSKDQHQRRGYAQPCDPLYDKSRCRRSWRAWTAPLGIGKSLWPPRPGTCVQCAPHTRFHDVDIAHDDLSLEIPDLPVFVTNKEVAAVSSLLLWILLLQLYYPLDYNYNSSLLLQQE